MCTACEQLIIAIDAYIRKADEKLSDTLGKEGFAEPEDTVRHIEQLEEELENIFGEQTDEFRKMLKKAMEQDNDSDTNKSLSKLFADFIKNDKTYDKLLIAFLENFTEYIPKLTNIYIGRLDDELVAEQISDTTSSWISQWSQEVSELMHLNSHKELEGILSDGMKTGSSVAEIARNILDAGIRDEFYKARRAALTETLRAHSVAQEEAIQQCPAAEFKEWVHTGSYRNEPRENHVKMSGQIVPKNSNFHLTGADGITYLADYPRDPALPAGESINCHCIHRGVVSEKILGLSLEERKKLQQQAIDEMGDDWQKELDAIDARNKARAGINEDTIKCDWLKHKKNAEERKKYFRNDSRWALFESGVIQNDKDLERLYKTVDTKYGPRKVFKSLTELKNDGIITVSKDRLEHSSLGDWTKTNRLDKGGHGQRGMEKLLSTGVEPVIYKQYSNGVRIGSVPNHKNPNKQTGNNKPNSDIGQSWFPENWDDDKIMLAGTYAANTGSGEGITRIGIYDGVEIVVYINDNEIGTICPNNMRQPKGDEWENARD